MYLIRWVTISTLSEKISNQWSTLMSNFRVVLNITQYLLQVQKVQTVTNTNFAEIFSQHLVLELIEYCSENWKTSWDCVRDRLNNVISFGFYFLNSNTICYGISLVYCCKKSWTKNIQCPKSTQSIFLNTVWKLHDFSITQILREINFGDSRSAKSAILTHSEALNFCTFWKLKFTKSTKFRAPKIAKMAVSELLVSPKLISRNIWVIEKSCNFHTVHYHVFTTWFFSTRPYF